MERNEISIHEARFYAVAEATKSGWTTSRELAKAAQIAERTARAYAQKFVSLGLFDVAEVFPAHRYRLSEKAGKRNAAYVTRLANAVEVFAIKT